MFRHLERLFIYDEVHTQEATARSLFRLAKSLFEGCSTLKKIGFYLCDPYVTVEKIVSSRFTNKDEIFPGSTHSSNDLRYHLPLVNRNSFYG